MEVRCKKRRRERPAFLVGPSDFPDSGPGEFVLLSDISFIHVFSLVWNDRTTHDSQPHHADHCSAVFVILVCLFLVFFQSEFSDSTPTKETPRPSFHLSGKNELNRFRANEALPEPTVELLIWPNCFPSNPYALPCSHECRMD